MVEEETINELFPDMLHKKLQKARLINQKGKHYSKFNAPMISNYPKTEQPNPLISNDSLLALLTDTKGTHPNAIQIIPHENIGEQTSGYFLKGGGPTATVRQFEFGANSKDKIYALDSDGVFKIWDVSAQSLNLPDPTENTNLAEDKFFEPLVNINKGESTLNFHLNPYISNCTTFVGDNGGIQYYDLEAEKSILVKGGWTQPKLKGPYAITEINCNWHLQAIVDTNNNLIIDDHRISESDRPAISHNTKLKAQKIACLSTYSNNLLLITGTDTTKKAKLFDIRIQKEVQVLQLETGRNHFYTINDTDLELFYYIPIKGGSINCFGVDGANNLMKVGQLKLFITGVEGIASLPKVSCDQLTNEFMRFYVLSTEGSTNTIFHYSYRTPKSDEIDVDIYPSCSEYPIRPIWNVGEWIECEKEKEIVIKKTEQLVELKHKIRVIREEKKEIDVENKKIQEERAVILPIRADNKSSSSSESEEEVKNEEEIKNQEEKEEEKYVPKSEEEKKAIRLANMEKGREKQAKIKERMKLEKEKKEKEKALEKERHDKWGKLIDKRAHGMKSKFDKMSADENENQSSSDSDW